MIDHSIFAKRRRQFMDRMNGGVALFPSAPVHHRNGDVEYEYRQDSDFYYLTGFEEPGAVCILAPQNPKHEFVLLVRPRDEEKEKWTGYRAGIEGAIQDYGAEMAYPVDQLRELLPQMIENAPALYYRFNRNREMDETVLSIVETMRPRERHGYFPPARFIDPGEILATMRLVKEDAEIDAMQRAVTVSSLAHVTAMKSVRPGKYEFEIQAVIEYVFRSRESARNGYPTIVASGPNACILHYTNNKRRMEDGDLLLVDAGAELDYYTGDITRTYPVNGKFSVEQKALYDVVLEAQKQSISAVKPGIAYSEIHTTAVRVLTEGLIHLGLLSGTREENIEAKNYMKYFYHTTGHWLGMDVHDAGKYRVGQNWTQLQAGMVVTVEPGLYISPGDENSRFRGMGIRIEDDILITDQGARVLSASCPKEIEDLEEVVGTMAENWLNL